MATKIGPKEQEPKLCALCKVGPVEMEAQVWVAAPTGVKHLRTVCICYSCVGRVRELVRAGERELVSFEGKQPCNKPK